MGKDEVFLALACKSATRLLRERQRLQNEKANSPEIKSYVF
jgi:hypothetical protein